MTSPANGNVMSSGGPDPLRLRQILVVIDGSDHSVDAVPWAASLAGKLHTEVQLLLVARNRSRNESREDADGPPAKHGPGLIFRSEMINRRVKNPADLDQLADALRGRGLVVSTRIASDRRGRELIEDVVAARPDLIALSGPNWTSLAGSLVNGIRGNVRASGQLFLVGPSTSKSGAASRAAAVFPARVIVGLDGSKDLEHGLAPAAAIAALLAVDLQLVSVVVAKDRPLFSWPIRSEAHDRALEEARTAAEAYAERLAAGLRIHGLSVTVDAQEGSVDRALLRAATQWRGSLVVIGSQSDVGVSLKLDPMVARVVNNISSPVLLIPKAGARRDSETFVWSAQDWLRHGEPQGDEPRSRELTWAC